MGYRQPNRTATFFRQVDMNRPAAARQKLGAAQGAQAVLQGQTAAQKQENQNVQNTQTQMTQAGAQGRQDTSNLAGFNTATNVLNEGGKIISGGTPVLQSGFTQGEKGQTRVVISGPARPDAIVGGSQPASTGMFGHIQPFSLGTPSAPGGSAGKDGYSLSAGQDATKIGADIQARNEAATQGFVKLADGTIARASDINLGEELSTAYGKAADTLGGFEKQMTEGNLGRLGAESEFEQEQADLARVLADRDSNIGKLKSLYGVGYDTGKYGALDSNLLQGQLADAAQESKTNLQNREKARAAGDLVRESYMRESDSQKEQLDKTKEETQKRVTEIDGKLGELKVKLEELKGKAGQEAAEARKKIADEANLLEKQRKDAVARGTASVDKKRSRYQLAGKLGISDKEAQGLSDTTVNAINQLMDPKLTNSAAIEKLRRNVPPALLEKIYRANPGLKSVHDKEVGKIAPMSKTDLTKAAMTGGLSVVLDKSKSGGEKKEAVRRTYNKFSNWLGGR